MHIRRKGNVRNRRARVPSARVNRLDGQVNLRHAGWYSSAAAGAGSRLTSRRCLSWAGKHPTACSGRSRSAARRHTRLSRRRSRAGHSCCSSSGCSSSRCESRFRQHWRPLSARDKSGAAALVRTHAVAVLPSSRSAVTSVSPLCSVAERIALVATKPAARRGNVRQHGNADRCRQRGTEQNLQGALHVHHPFRIGGRYPPVTHITNDSG